MIYGNWIENLNFKKNMQSRKLKNVPVFSLRIQHWSQMPLQTSEKLGTLYSTVALSEIKKKYLLS